MNVLSVVDSNVNNIDIAVSVAATHAENDVSEPLGDFLFDTLAKLMKVGNWPRLYSHEVKTTTGDAVEEVLADFEITDFEIADLVWFGLVWGLGWFGGCAALTARVDCSCTSAHTPTRLRELQRSRGAE